MRRQFVSHLPAHRTATHDRNFHPLNLYETEKLLSEYLLFHYGSAEDLLGNFPGPGEAAGFAPRLVRQLLDTSILPPDASALDVGCAVGGSSFELTKHCQNVLGIDFSASFVRAAAALAEGKTIACEIAVEGTRTQTFEAGAPAETHPSRAQFETGDAMDLRPDLGTFDVVLAANLLCRLREPRLFLARLPGLVKPGAQLLLTTPFTWLEEFTPMASWIGGTSTAGPSADALTALLSADFTLSHQENIPFLIREHSRKFQYSVAWGTRWIRK